MSHYAEFDSVIVNEDFERAVRELLDVLRGSQNYGSGRASLTPLVADLLG